MEEPDAVCIQVYGDHSFEALLQSGNGFSVPLLDRLRRISDSAEINQALLDGKPLFGRISALDGSALTSFADDGFRTVGVIPFTQTTRTLGALVVSSKAVDHFSSTVRYALESVASHITTLITRIRNEEELKRINRDLAKLNTQLTISEERYRTVVEDQTDLISRYRPNGTITFVNSSYCNYFGLSRDEIIGRSFMPTVLPEDREKTRDHIRSLTPDNPVSIIEHRIVLPNGNERWMEWTDRAICDNKGKIIEYQSVGRDTTDRKQSQERLQFMSMHDPLTGLHNRTYFDDQMKRLAHERYLPVGVIVIDLNALKIVNDALGHQNGDLLILSASDVISQCFRGTDIVTRVGGDEFAVLLPNTVKSDIVLTVQRLKKAIAKFRDDSRNLPLSLAVGYSIREAASVSLEEIFAEADDRMYREKEMQRDFARGLVLTSLLRAIEIVDKYRSEHMMRVRSSAHLLATNAGIMGGEIQSVLLSARYHDIGMVSIDHERILVPRSLPKEDMDAVRRHPETGARIAVAHPFLRDIAPHIRHHHERWDGGGYPDGLIGGAIPFPSRVISICDTFDSMVHNSVYRAPLAKEAAADEIERLGGSQFDPSLASIFAGLVRGGSISREFQ